MVVTSIVVSVFILASKDKTLDANQEIFEPVQEPQQTQQQGFKHKLYFATKEDSTEFSQYLKDSIPEISIATLVEGGMTVLSFVLPEQIENLEQFEKIESFEIVEVW